MKKLALISLSVLTLAACSEKDEYHQTVLDLVSNDEDVRSYHIDPATIATCIVDLTSKEMPGTLPFEPRRKEAYKGYTKMISLKTSEKPAEVLNELRESFGSAKGLADAHMIYSESYLECMSNITNRVLDEKEEQEKGES
ncbi:MAG: hypothetical protein PSN04_07235 [Methyloprofundus sp.]|nr:hypothetical protein [Methyloprofundus sp.]